MSVALQPPVAVIIVNWNCWQDTLNAISSVRTFADKITSIIVVDNGSTDNSLLELKARLSSTVLIESPVNLGFSGGCNLGMARAFADGARYAFLLNPDAKVCERTIQVLIAEAQKVHDHIAIGSIIRFEVGGDYQFIGSQEDPISGHPKWFDPKKEQSILKQATFETDYIMGAALFIPRVVYDLAGPLPEQYFLYYEETDWCYRTRRKGIPCIMASESVVTHKGSGTVGPSEGPLQTYFCVRNELLFLERNGHRGQLRRRQFNFCFRIFKRLVKAIIQRKVSLNTRALMMGFFDYFLKRFGDCPSDIRRLAQLYSSGSR